MKLLGALFLIFLLAACGGGAETSEQGGADLASRGLNGSGQFVQPQANEVFQSNLVFSIQANDPDGLQQVSLVLGDGDIILCQNCAGNDYETIQTGVNPGFFGLTPGTITIALEITDSVGNLQRVAERQIDWQPIQLADVAIERTQGQIQVNWLNHDQFLRYNLYLAAEPGVNRDSYQQLQQGQALLAVNAGPQTFMGIQDTQQLYLLLMGIDGGGESSLPVEFVIPPLGNQVNQPPTANDDNASTIEDTLVTITPLDNDTDPEGDLITLTAAQADSGQLSFTDTQIEFTPAANFFGQVIIDYSIQDIAFNQASAQIFVTVTPVNDVPSLTDDTATTLANTPVNIDVLDNDADVDGDTLTVTEATAANGAVVIEADNTLTYTPNTAFNGQDILDYSVSDGNGGTASAQVQITVSLNNQAPQAGDDSYAMFQDRTLTVAAGSGLLINDSDANGDLITVNTQPVIAPASGTLNLQNDGGFDYTPTAAFVGTDEFTYQITDPTGASAQAQVSINVQAIPADLTGDSLSITGEFLYIGQGEDTPGSGQGTGLYRIGNCLQIIDTRCTMIGGYQEQAASGNAPLATGTYAFIMTYSGTGNSPVAARSTQPGGNILSFITVGDALFELFLFPDSGGRIYSVFPDASFSTLRNFGAFITNSATCTGLPVNQACSIGNVGLTPGAEITAPLDRLDFIVSGLSTVDDNSTPVAAADQYQVTAGQAFSVNAPGVLANDTDADNPVVGDVLNIDFPIAANFAQAIALAADEHRQLVYIYPAFFPTIQVLDRQGQPLNTINWPGEGANDADIDIAPEALVLNGVNVPQGSVLVINGETDEAEIYALDPVSGNQLAQLPTAFGNSQVVGGAYNPITDSFFLLQDNSAGGANANRVAEIDPATGDIIRSFQLDGFDVSFGDLDVNDQTGSLYLVSSDENSMSEWSTDGQFIRQLALPALLANLSGLAINGESNRLWGINSSLQSPVYEVSFDNNGTFPALLSTLVTPPENGALELNLDGSFTYTPNAGFVGTDSFTYQLSDAQGQVAQGLVTLTVQ